MVRAACENIDQLIEARERLTLMPFTLALSPQAGRGERLPLPPGREGVAVRAGLNPPNDEHMSVIFTSFSRREGELSSACLRPCMARQAVFFGEVVEFDEGHRGLWGISVAAWPCRWRFQ